MLSFPRLACPSAKNIEWGLIMLANAACILSGSLAVIFAAMMVFQRSLYASAICLLLVLLQTSVLFYLSGSPMLAFLQVMVYAGAVMVLVVITIMAAPSPAQRRWGAISLPKPLAAAGLLLPLADAAVLLSKASLPSPSRLAGVFVPAQAALGSVLFGPYAVATEAVALLLFLSALALVESK